MKSYALLIIALCLPLSLAAADTLVRIESHTDDYYYGGRVHAAVNRTIDVWFGDDKMAYKTENRTIILDLKNNSLTFVNLEDSTYVETALPLDWSAVVSEGTLSFLQRYERHGTIEKTGETKKIGKWNCSAYEIESWINTDSGRYDEREEKIWASADLPIDWELYGRLQPHVAKLRNNEKEFIAKLQTMKGFPVSTDAKVHITGFSVNSYERVTEAAEKTPPPGTYAVPEGFSKKEELTMQDLRG